MYCCALSAQFTFWILHCFLQKSSVLCICAIHFLTFAQFCAEIANRPYCRFLERLSTAVGGCSAVFRSSKKGFNNNGTFAAECRKAVEVQSSTEYETHVGWKWLSAASACYALTSHKFSLIISLWKFGESGSHFINFGSPGIPSANHPHKLTVRCIVFKSW